MEATKIRGPFWEDFQSAHPVLMDLVECLKKVDDGDLTVEQGVHRTRQTMATALAVARKEGADSVINDASQLADRLEALPFNALKAALDKLGTRMCMECGGPRGCKCWNDE